MKKKTANSTVNYDPEKISETTAIHFTKVTNASGTTLYGKIVKNDAEVGNVSYDEKGNYMVTSIKPYSTLTNEEVKTIYGRVPDCINEALAEE